MHSKSCRFYNKKRLKYDVVNPLSISRAEDGIEGQPVTAPPDNEGIANVRLFCRAPPAVGRVRLWPEVNSS